MPSLRQQSQRTYRFLVKIVSATSTVLGRTPLQYMFVTCVRGRHSSATGCANDKSTNVRVVVGSHLMSPTISDTLRRLANKGFTSCSQRRTTTLRATAGAGDVNIRRPCCALDGVGHGQVPKPRTVKPKQKNKKNKNEMKRNETDETPRERPSLS